MPQIGMDFLNPARRTHTTAYLQDCKVAMGLCLGSLGQVLDKSSKRSHHREHRRNEAGIRRRSPHSALFRPIVAVCPHDEPGGASSPATQSDHAQPLQVEEVVPEGSDRYRRAGQCTQFAKGDVLPAS